MWHPYINVDIICLLYIMYICPLLMPFLRSLLLRIPFVVDPLLLSIGKKQQYFLSLIVYSVYSHSTNILWQHYCGQIISKCYLSTGHYVYKQTKINLAFLTLSFLKCWILWNAFSFCLMALWLLWFGTCFIS